METACRPRRVSHRRALFETPTARVDSAASDHTQVEIIDPDTTNRTMSLATKTFWLMKNRSLNYGVDTGLDFYNSECHGTHDRMTPKSCDPFKTRWHEETKRRPRCFAESPTPRDDLEELRWCTSTRTAGRLTSSHRGFLVQGLCATHAAFLQRALECHNSRCIPDTLLLRGRTRRMSCKGHR